MNLVDAMYATFWALIPPIVAIVLALITKEVYSSLFIGILVGGLFYSGFSFEGTLTHIFNDGFVAVLSDAYNVAANTVSGRRARQRIRRPAPRKSFFFFILLYSLFNM